MKRSVSTALYVLSCISAGIALLLLVLTAVLTSSQLALALHVSPVALAITKAMPGFLSFWGVLGSPFGGVFRTDFVLMAIVMFVASKLFRYVGRRMK